MEHIIEVTDNDFGITETKNTNEPITRYGARGIVINEEGKIAVINKQKKNEYKLPGGGIDSGEYEKTAFERECKEELGVNVKIIEELGTVKEYKSKENFMQISYVFVAEKKEELESNNLTEKEIAEGTRYLWLDIEDALSKMKECLNNLKESEYDNVYRTKFIVLRDIRILEYYIGVKK